MNSNKKNKVVPTGIKGITPAQIKALAESQRVKAKVPPRRVNGRQQLKRGKVPIVKGTGLSEPVDPRPNVKYLTNLATNVTRIVMPEAGSFNPGLAKIPNSDNYVMVYRPNEYLSLIHI